MKWVGAFGESVYFPCYQRRMLLGAVVIAVLLPGMLSAEALPSKLAPFFRPPAEFANDLGGYRSPLLFADGSPVKTPADWEKRRGEIRQYWHELMGPWPALIEKPKLEFLGKERGDGFTNHRVRVQVAPDRTTDGYLLMPDGKGPFPAVIVVFYEPETAIGKGKSPRRDFALLLVKRGIAALSIGGAPETYYPPGRLASFSRCLTTPTKRPIVATPWRHCRTLTPSASALPAIPTAASGRYLRRAFTTSSPAPPGPTRASFSMRSARMSTTGTRGTWVSSRAKSGRADCRPPRTRPSALARSCEKPATICTNCTPSWRRGHFWRLVAPRIRRSDGRRSITASPSTSCSASQTAWP